MAALSARDLLDLWEACVPRSPLDRAVYMLWASGEAGAAEAADVPVAARDRALLALRKAQLGEQLDIVAECPNCAAELELSVPADDLIDAITPPRVAQIAVGGATIDIPPLTSADLAVGAGVDADALPDLFRDRLVGDVPAGDRDAVDAAIEAQAEASELRLSLTCAECDHAWTEPWDVAGHVWTELDLQARRTMGEVAELARAYGWSEDQSLMISAHRRAAYLDMARAGV